MIKVIFGLSLFLIALIVFILVFNIANDCEPATISSCIIAIIMLIAIAVMSDDIISEPTYKSVINKKAKYNEVLYIDNNDTIKIYEVVRNNEDNKK